VDNGLRVWCLEMCGNVDWIQLTQDSIQVRGQALVNTVMN
jgi:hypothetical protein